MSASDTVRGRLWMWGHEAGSHDNGWKLPKPSRMTPAEGALYLVGELNAVKEKLDLQERRLDLYAICYDKWFGWNLDDHFSLCDHVIFWTWRSETLERLDENFRRFEEITPRNDRLLGCYLYDYGNCTPMSLDRMKMQCETGLQLLMEGRIVGIVFLASCVCDIELEAVEWTREWISEIALEKLPA